MIVFWKKPTNELQVYINFPNIFKQKNQYHLSLLCVNDVNIYIMNPKFDKYLDEASQCVKCGICQHECPTYIATGDESMVARGRLALLEAVAEGDLKFSSGIADRMSKCTSCLSCVTNCPRGIDPVKIINAAKGEYFEKNGSDFISKMVFKYLGNNERSLYPLFKLIGMASNLFYSRIPAEGWLKESLPFVKNGIKKNFPQFGKRNLKDALPEIVKVKNPKMRVAFFTGCMTDFVFQETGQKIISILKANNIETIIPKNIGCCGAPAYYMGDHKTALKLARENFRILSQLNPDYIIFNCATCGKVLKSIYETLLNLNGDFSCFSKKVIDIHKFLVVNKCKTEDLQNEEGSENKAYLATIKQLQKVKSANKKIRVTYHDPCHLKRGLNTYLEPREILKSLPMVDFVEMESPDACCGGAGGFNLKHYDLSLQIGKRKAESIKRTGADVVVTGCPSCQMQIMDVLHRADYDRPVLHTVELLNSKILA